MLQGDLSSNILTDAITHRDTAVFLSQAHKATMVLTGAKDFRDTLFQRRNKVITLNSITRTCKG